MVDLEPVQWGEGMLDAMTILIAHFTCNCRDMTSQVNISALIENSLIGVSYGESYASSWNNMLGYTQNHTIEETQSILGRWYTLYELMTMACRDREEFHHFMLCRNGGIVNGKEWKSDGKSRLEWEGGIQWDVGNKHFEWLQLFYNSSFWRLYMLNTLSHLQQLKWYLQWLTTFSSVTVSLKDLLYLLSSRSLSTTTLPLPENSKLCYLSLFLCAMIINYSHWVHCEP